MNPRIVAGLALAVACSALARRDARAQQRTSSPVISLDSLLNTRISAASKYAQTTAEAPASVTILTAEDLERSGYRTLLEALESVRGFYVSDDGNYPYLGTRGFSRPSDYNNRILVLLDGHAINEQTWGGAPVGSDLPIDMDAIERIEVVRGPGSTLYGTSAMFAVINIVMKSGAALDGMVAGARLGTGRSRQATLAAGHSLGADASFSMSGLVSRSDGTDRYYPEFDTPETNRGVAHGLDWERGVSGVGALSIHEVTARVGYISRGTGIPTAAFDEVFNDPRAETVDETFWGEISHVRQLGNAFRLSTRLYADRHRYRGVYPRNAGPGAYSDGGGSTWLGGEATGIWEPTSRNRLTVGSEVRRVARAEYYERDVDSTETRDNVPSNVGSVFAQDELQLTPIITLIGGLRFDRTSRHGNAFSPRVALIVTPSRVTTLKALYGEAFRAPSAAEADLTTTFYARNPTLQAERIRTLELSASHRVVEPLLVTGSVYAYGVRNLIDQVEFREFGVQYRNEARASGTGADVEVDFRPAGVFGLHGSYAFQQARNAPSHERMTNSPEQIATAGVTTTSKSGVKSALAWRYESGRRTIAGPSTPAFLRTDANVSYTPTARGFAGVQLGMRVTNLFDVSYSVPGGLEHRQVSIPQDGRALSLQLTWRY